MPPPDPSTDGGGILGLLGRMGNPAALYQGNLADPATQQAIAGRGLLSLAGGFADAAMPSRMPIPFGAALGHAAAAMGQGQDAIMQARLQAAQAQQEQALASLTGQKVSMIPQFQSAFQEYLQGGGGGIPQPGMPNTAGGATGGPVGPSVGSNSANTQQILAKYGDLIQKAAATHNVDPNLIAAVISTESGGDPNSVNKASGASGLGNIMPATAKELGIINIFDPEENINGVAKYLRRGLDANNGDTTQALRYYNGGPKGPQNLNTANYPNLVYHRMPVATVGKGDQPSAPIQVASADNAAPTVTDATAGPTGLLTPPRPQLPSEAATRYPAPVGPSGQTTAQLAASLYPNAPVARPPAPQVAAAQPGVPPGAAPPAGPPQPLVTPPGPAPTAPPITQPQPQAVPTAGGPGGGAPSPAKIRAAQQLNYLWPMVFGGQAPAEIAETAAWDIKGAEAQREAQIKLQSTPFRPSGVLLRGFDANGQPIWMQAPATPQVGTAYNPQTERPEIAGVTPQPSGPPIVSPTGIPSGPSEQEKAAAATRGKYATGVPGNPAGPPGTVFPQGVDPTKPIPSPANAGRSYQTVIPPINRQAGATELNTYGQSMPDWQKESGDLADAGLKAQNAEVNLMGIVKAYQMVETGTWAMQKAEFAGVLKALNLPVPDDAAGLAALQTGLHNLYKETLQDLAGANKRFTGNEFKVNTEAGASAGNQPAANLILLSQDLGRLRQIQALATDWNHARTMVGSDGAYWYNPDSFKTAWIQSNPLQPMVDQARKEIGWLGGTVPPEMPPGTKALPLENGRPRYLLPDGQIIRPKVQPNG